jgi:hypothetical protein
MNRSHVSLGLVVPHLAFRETYWSECWYEMGLLHIGVGDVLHLVR